MPKDSTPPVVPVGVTSKVGLAVSALLALIAAVSAILKGDHSEATIEAGAVAAVTLWIVLGGRFAQAHKATSPQPTPQGDRPLGDVVGGRDRQAAAIKAAMIELAAQKMAPEFDVAPAADEEPGDEDGLNGIQPQEKPDAPDQGDGGGA